MREALENFSGGFKIGGRTVNNLRYADDIVLITTTPTELQALLNRIRIAGMKHGLVINKGKTCPNSPMTSECQRGQCMKDGREGNSYSWSSTTWQQRVLCSQTQSQPNTSTHCTQVLLTVHIVTITLTAFVLLLHAITEFCVQTCNDYLQVLYYDAAKPSV